MQAADMTFEFSDDNSSIDGLIAKFEEATKDLKQQVADKMAHEKGAMLQKHVSAMQKVCQRR